jgi:epoxyqueuosine reductase
VGDLSDLPALEHAAADPDPLIAEHAAWGIEQIQKRCEMLVPEAC